MIRNRLNLYIIGLMVLLFSNIYSWVLVYDLSDAASLEVTFFDVGQGDAALIEHPGQKQIVIDGGPSSAVLDKLGKEMLPWDRSIDLIVLTHPEADHMNGLIEILKNYDVKNILWTGVKRDTSEFKEWESLTEKEGAKVFFAQAGMTVVMLPLKLHILSPGKNLKGQEVKNVNDSSVVMRLDYYANSFLFTGDAFKGTERRVADSANIKADVLKIGHHGSKTSSDDLFISEVSPDVAVISAGKDNRYGHPHQETLDTLKKYGINIFRTDEKGDVKIFSNGKNISY